MKMDEKAVDGLVDGAPCDHRRRLQVLRDVTRKVSPRMSARGILRRALAEAAACYPGMRIAFFTVDRNDTAHVIDSRQPRGMLRIAGNNADLSDVPEYRQQLHNGDTVVVEQVDDDARVAGLKEMFRTNGTQSILNVPLRRGAALRGVLGVGSPQPREWDNHDIDVLEDLAAYLSVALSYALERRRRRKVEAELAVNQERHGALSTELFAAREQERVHISRELHDQVGQSLTAVKLSLAHVCDQLNNEEICAQISKTQALIDVVLDSVRALSLDLRPPLLDELGLAAAVAHFTEAFGDQLGIPVTLTTAESLNLPAEVGVTAFRVLQEALTNVARHADASRVAVSIAQQDARLVMTVEDDGVGFSPDHVLSTATADHLGLIGMRERAAMLEGTVTFDSDPGGGTIVRVEIPLRAEG